MRCSPFFSLFYSILLLAPFACSEPDPIAADAVAAADSDPGDGDADLGGDGDPGADPDLGGDDTPLPQDPPLLSLCTFDGAAMVGDSRAVIGEVASEATGWLLVVDDAGNLRRYLDAGGEPCTLQLDSSFGVEGVLDLPERVVSLAIDPQETIYVGYFGGVARIDSGATGASCGRSADTLAVSGDGQLLLGSWVANPTSFSFATAGCDFASWPADSSLVGIDVISIIGDRVVVAGSGEVGSSTKPVIAHDYQGNALFPLATDSSVAGERLCRAGAISGCPAGFCILDIDCPKIIEVDSSGARVAVVDLAPPFDDPTTPVSLVVDADGYGYLTVAAESGPGQFEGRIYRIDAR